MSKVLSAVYGIGIAVVLYVTMLLGIQAFYPEPDYEAYCDTTVRYAEPYYAFEGCTDDMTVAQCRDQNVNQKDNSAEWQKCQEAYEKANESYGRNFFILASTLGVIALIVAFYLLVGITSMSITNISAGVACAGIVMVLWAFIRGWDSTDDIVKFIVGLVIAVIVITLSVMLNKRPEHAPAKTTTVMASKAKKASRAKKAGSKKKK